LVLLDLASHCRLLFYDRPRHPKLFRWVVLYPLYALSEVAIISTDLAELLGSAIALNLIFPGLPLWAGVLFTAFDVLLILAFADPLHGRPVRSFELVIGILVSAPGNVYTSSLDSPRTGLDRISLPVYPCLEDPRRLGRNIPRTSSLQGAGPARRPIHL
jgi:hypothetical protein